AQPRAARLPEPCDQLPGIARGFAARALQQQRAVGIDQLEVEAPVGLAVLLELRQRGLGGRLPARAAGALRQVAQADRIAQLAQQRLRMGFAQAQGAVAQQALDLLRLGHQRLVALAQRRDFRIDALEQPLLGIAPADALLELPPHRRGFVLAGGGLVELEHVGAVGVLGLPRRTRIGDDRGDQLAQRRRWREQRDRVVVTLRHLAAVETGQRGHVLLDHRLGQAEVLLSGRLAVKVVEALAEVARHLDVLDLVAAHRHAVGVEQQDVGGHQHRVHEQPRVDAGVVVLAVGAVAVDRRLVGVRPVEDALAGHAREQPGQLGGLGHVGLAVEPDLARVQPAGQPRGGDFQRGALHARRVLHLDQRVQVGEEVEALDVRRLRRGHRRADRTDVVAQVRGAGSGDAGEDAGLARGHGVAGACVAVILARRRRRAAHARSTATPIAAPARFRQSPPRRPAMSRILPSCRAALLAALACFAPAAFAHVELAVVDRDDGRWLPQYPHRGDRWLAGVPGHRYAVRLTNTSNERVLVVLSVDGVNAVTGEDADPSQA